MGKNLIIKGADFSENALNSLQVYKEITTEGLRDSQFLATSAVPTTNGFWGGGLIFDETLLNKEINTIILNLISGGRYSEQFTLDIPISIVRLTLDESPSTIDKLADVYITNDDIVNGRKIVTIPSTIISSNQQTIAVGAWDKANVANNRRIMFPVGYRPSGGPSIGVSTNGTIADNSSWAGLPTIGYGYRHGE